MRSKNMSALRDNDEVLRAYGCASYALTPSGVEVDGTECARTLAK